VDYVDLGVYKHSYTKILLIIVPRSVIKRHSELIVRAGLRLERGVFAPEAIARHADKLLRVTSDASAISIVHIDDESTDFSVIFKNKLLFVRNIPLGANQLAADAPKSYDAFIRELQVSLESYQSEYIERTPLSIILTGAVGSANDLAAIMPERIHIPMKVIPALKNAVLSGQAAKVVSQSDRISFLGGVAGLASEDRGGVNLVPEEVKLRKSVEERGKELIKTGALILTAFVLIFSITLGKIYFKGMHLARLKAQAEPLSEKTKVLESDFTRFTLIREYLAKRGFPLEVLAELHTTIPLGLEITDIRFEKSERLSVRGTAAALQTVFSFVENMSRSEYFKDVKTKYTTTRREASKDVTDFEIVCVLTPVRPEKP
jgi:Tfp pilus assembly protein PilN